ncbi:hypothetical protein SEETMRM10961_8740 [Salmonella enterica subsp. enterica serovar Typhimurium]|nr:hypothetical protein SEETMRM10961_8740 [Salmonella enterica subsp. enterica serovar Typhimurium]
MISLKYLSDIWQL